MVGPLTEKLHCGFPNYIRKKDVITLKNQQHYYLEREPSYQIKKIYSLKKSNNKTSNKYMSSEWENAHENMKKRKLFQYAAIHAIMVGNGIFLCGLLPRDQLNCQQCTIMYFFLVLA